MRYLIHTLAIILLACCCHAQGKGKADVSTIYPPARGTNDLGGINNPIQIIEITEPLKLEKQKEKKLVHEANKLTIKERDKGSKNESDYKPVKEYPLMFKNNRKGRKDKK